MSNSSSDADINDTTAVVHTTNKRIRWSESATSGTSLTQIPSLTYTKYHFRDLELRIEDFILLVFERNMNFHKMGKRNQYVHTNFVSTSGQLADGTISTSWHILTEVSAVKMWQLWLVIRNINASFTNRRRNWLRCTKSWKKKSIFSFKRCIYENYYKCRRFEASVQQNKQA